MGEKGEDDKNEQKYSQLAVNKSDTKIIYRNNVDKKQKNSIDNDKINDIESEKNAQPIVTLLVTAYNEEDYVDKKIQNSLQLTYPPQKLRHVWVTDGSTDSTNARLARYAFVRTLHQPERKGKTAAINRAIPLIDTQLVVMTDANAMLNPNAIDELVKPFADAHVGCVAGEKRVVTTRKHHSGASSSGEGYYWKYESMVKRLESNTGAVLSAAGELFAIRTKLFKPIAEDTILDDFCISLNIVKQGFKVIYTKKALATEFGSANFSEEMKRKVRIAAGGFQLMARNKQLLNPFKHPGLTFKYLSHKVLRWAVVPFCLFLLPLANAWLLMLKPTTFYTVSMAAIALAYLSALFGYIARNKNLKPHIVYMPFYALMANVAQIQGLIRHLNKQQSSSWEKAKRQH